MKAQHGNNYAAIGAQAKRDFNQLVPFAKRATAEQYDGCRYFDVKGLIVAVKYITLGVRGSWVFAPAPAHYPAPDVYVLFCANQPNNEKLSEYSLYFIPHHAVSTAKSVQFRQGPRNRLAMYQVENPTELADILS
jgi:hypothetical protein